MLGGGDNEALGRMSFVSSLPLQLNPATISGEMASSSLTIKKDDRVPQWSHQETRDFIATRAELERDFTVTKRNKTLWEIVAAKMKEKGYRRNPEQCKCKWKNLVNRYKGKETSDPENGRQCPFFEELQAVFNEREKNMRRLLLESEASSGLNSKKRMKKLAGGDRSSNEFSDDEGDDEEDSDDESRLTRTGNLRKRKGDKERPLKATVDKSARSNSGIDSIHEILQEFLQQQQRVEMQWREMMERRARERQMLEQEWRHSMEKLERERLLMERAWREREEERRMKEESRAEKRDALLTSLLNKLIHEEHL